MNARRRYVAKRRRRFHRLQREHVSARYGSAEKFRRHRLRLIQARTTLGRTRSILDLFR